MKSKYHVWVFLGVGAAIIAAIYYISVYAKSQSLAHAVQAPPEVE